jgi:hypothetical protein
MCVELMLTCAVNLTFVAFSRFCGAAGQVFVVFVMTVSAAEAAGIGDHHRDLQASTDGRSQEHQPAQGMMLLQAAAAATFQLHPLSGTVAEWVWLLPVLPLAGFVINGLLSLSGAHFGPKDPSAAGHHPHSEAALDAIPISHDESGASGDDHHPVKRHRWATLVSIVGPGVLILSFILAVAIWQAMVAGHPEAPFIQRYFSWMPAGDLQIEAAFQLDQLSMVMILVITGVGALIHVFSVGYMRDDPSYPRFFSYLNLFVFFMLVLVLGASYPVLFVGWEGVGLCSYLLIGFWFNDKVNADAGKKAFIVNRIGDFGLLVAMFMLFSKIGVLDFLGVNARAADLGAGSAAGDDHLPVHVPRLPAGAQSRSTSGCPIDGGSTPVSALIRGNDGAAGVYLIAQRSASRSRRWPADGSPSWCSDGDLCGDDRTPAVGYESSGVLTISQLGYMFVGVGVGAYVSGMFHLVTHAFFEALYSSDRFGDPRHAAYHPRTARGRWNATCWPAALSPGDVRADVVATLCISEFHRSGVLLRTRFSAPFSPAPGLDAGDCDLAQWRGTLLYIICCDRTDGGVPDRDLHDADDAVHFPRPDAHRDGGREIPARGAVGDDGSSGGARNSYDRRWLAESAGDRHRSGPDRAGGGAWTFPRSGGRRRHGANHRRRRPGSSDD